MNLTAKKIYSVLLLTAMLCGLFSSVFLAQAAQARFIFIAQPLRGVNTRFHLFSITDLITPIFFVFLVFSPFYSFSNLKKSFLRGRKKALYIQWIQFM